MASSRIAALRSVALTVPDLDATARFYEDVWRLETVVRDADAIYFRGTGPAHHILALHRGAKTAIRNVTLQARSREALDGIAESTPAAGGRVIAALAPIDEPGGGIGITIADPDGRIFRIVHGDE